MDFDRYAQRLSFRYLSPSISFRGLGKIDRLLGRLGYHLEMFNTNLPEDQESMRKKLKGLLQIKRMSTFAIGTLINKAVSDMNSEDSFVNVGVWHGFTFFAGMAGNLDKSCIAIDNFSQFDGPKEEFLSLFNRYKSDKQYFFEMDYRQYFEHAHQSRIGVYIYDGEHSYQNQLHGLEIAEPFFSKDCVVLVDDTNWVEPRQATLDFIAKSKNSYELILDVTTCRNWHPTFWNGLMVFRRR